MLISLCTSGLFVCDWVRVLVMFCHGCHCFLILIDPSHADLLVLCVFVADGKLWLTIWVVLCFDVAPIDGLLANVCFGNEHFGFVVVSTVFV